MVANLSVDFLSCHVLLSSKRMTRDIIQISLRDMVTRKIFGPVFFSHRLPRVIRIRRQITSLQRGLSKPFHFLP